MKKVNFLDQKIRILGVDPGSQRTGIAMLEFHLPKAGSFQQMNQIKPLQAGVLSAKSTDFHQRILEITSSFETHLLESRPDFVVFEKVFLGKNPDSAFKLGHIRGALMVAALKHRVVLHEMATRKVKKIVTGNGGSEKKQVLLSLCHSLKISPEAFENLTEDASDALALAYAFVIDQWPSLEGLFQKLRQQDILV
jgi:crossover junction endodeoxyribonuclease RuvC